MPPRYFEKNVGEEHQGVRLDVYLADVIEDASRSFIKKVIKEGGVTVNGGVCKRPGRTMNADDKVAVVIPPGPGTDLTPEDIPLEILYQDADLLVVNKSAGLVVHPAPGHYRGTLVNAILHHCPDFQLADSDPVRPGIVHRLDRFTSGALVVAKTPRAYSSLAQQARDHSFERHYVALVRGEFPEDRGRIEASVGRSLSDPSRMSVTGINARDAVTHFEVIERFGVASMLKLILETGRTHQIRVHLRFAGRPVLGDPVYGVTEYSAWKTRLGGGRNPADAEALDALEHLEGQALHAERLGIKHPVTGERMAFTAPLPNDFQRVLEALRAACVPPL